MPSWRTTWSAACGRVVIPAGPLVPSTFSVYEGRRGSKIDYSKLGVERALLA
jgi:hypothetical protein